jgi:phosphate transport system protein
MTREAYRTQLDDLREEIRGMSELVIERLNTGLDALSRHDDRLARTVLHGDEAVNQRYLSIEELCIELFALQQPVATDLRLVTASFKISTDLERVGDLAANLGEHTLAAEGKAFPEIDVTALGRFALSMLEDAMEAYATEDAHLCREIAARDDQLDTRCERATETVIRELVETDRSDGVATEVLLADVSRLFLTIRDLERVGDHAVNIAARTLYMTESDSELLY